MSNLWLQEVEAVEERLEALKLTRWRLPAMNRLIPPTSVVRSTAGLLKFLRPSGREYERRLRRTWQRAMRQRAA